MTQIILDLRQVFASAHASNKVRGFSILVTIDCEELLLGDGVGDDLTESCLAAAGFSNHKYRFFVQKTFVNERCKSFKLST